MGKTVNRQVVLAARPHGHPRPSDFEIVERPVPVPGDGQVLLRNLLVSLDPYNRIIMGDAGGEPSPIDPVALGDPMSGFAVAVVERSNHPAFAPGDHVAATSGWQDYAVSDGSDLRVLDPAAAPLPANLGVLGMTGLTAWVGLTRVVDPLPGGTLVVTAAAGAVGSVAAQLGRLRGHRVVGVAGGAEKVRHLVEDLRLDAAVDHRAPDFADQLAGAVPDGVDTVFESVGSVTVEALLPHLNQKAQLVVCGVMSQINRTRPHDGPNRLPDLLKAVLYRDLTLRGFSVPDHFDRYPEFLAEVAPRVAGGELRYAEHVVDGLESIPAEFPKTFQGGTTGKVIATVAAR